MGETLRASVGEIESIRKEIENSFAQLGKEQADLLASVKALGTMWEGPAHEMIQKSMEDDLAKLEELRQNAHGLLDFEGKAVQEFGGAEAQISDKIHSI